MVRICWATTDNTSKSIRLNSSKHDHAPHEARPCKSKYIAINKNIDSWLHLLTDRVWTHLRGNKGQHKECGCFCKDQFFKTKCEPVTMFQTTCIDWTKCHMQKFSNSGELPKCPKSKGECFTINNSAVLLCKTFHDYQLKPGKLDFIDCFMHPKVFKAQGNNICRLSGI